MNFPNVYLYEYPIFPFLVKVNISWKKVSSFFLFVIIIFSFFFLFLSFFFSYFLANNKKSYIYINFFLSVFFIDFLLSLYKASPPLPVHFKSEKRGRGKENIKELQNLIVRKIVVKITTTLIKF